MDTTVSQTILSQLGGRRFTIMTGAKHHFGERALTIRMPKTGKDKSNTWVITLNGATDTYDIETFFVRGATRNLKSTFTDIYAENLVELFERVSGFYTKL